jgi:DNA-binding FadR family transcriptional regulator
MESAARRPKRRHDEVVERLVARIVSGELAPGAILPAEPELAHQLGVSRTVLREALRVVAEKGLIEARQGSGTRVAPASNWDQFDEGVLKARYSAGAMLAVLSDMIEARRVVECEVAALAAERSSESHRSSLERELERMQQSLDHSALYAAADADFHRTILLAADNAILLRMMDPIRALIAFGQGLTDSLKDEQRRALGEHRAIAEAIRNRDSGAARGAMREHLANTEHDLRRILKER